MIATHNVFRKGVEMINRRTLVILSAFILLGIVSGCGGSTTPAQPTQALVPVQPTQTQEIQLTPIQEQTQAPSPTQAVTTNNERQEPAFAEFDPANFDDSANIDNKWSPMQPGTFWAYEGNITEDGEIVPHRIEFIVTDLVKEIENVRTAVTWSVDYTGGKLVEKEISFYAQDNDGRVWYLGEYPEEYEDDKFVKAPTWIAGIEGARAGVKMQAEPQVGLSSLFQGWGPAVEWSDYGMVDQMGLQTCVPVDCYEDVLVIAESSLDEKGAFQLKYFAPDVGEIQVGWRGADLTQEELVLTEYKLLSQDELAEVRAMALSLEKHGYEVSKEVYALTSPSE